MLNLLTGTLSVDSDRFFENDGLNNALHAYFIAICQFRNCFFKALSEVYICVDNFFSYGPIRRVVLEILLNFW